MEHVLSAASRAAPRRPGFLRRLLCVMAMSRSQRRLGELDDHLLRDIGVTRAQARHESGLIDWNAPDHWLR